MLTKACACLHVHDSLYTQVYDTAELVGGREMAASRGFSYAHAGYNVSNMQHGLHANTAKVCNALLYTLHV
jgi:hypothetical protein